VTPKNRRRRKMFAPPPAEFSTARHGAPARHADFTAAAEKGTAARLRGLL